MCSICMTKVRGGEGARRPVMVCVCVARARTCVCPNVVSGSTGTHSAALVQEPLILLAFCHGSSLDPLGATPPPPPLACRGPGVPEPGADAFGDPGNVRA
jgi:hypothetical protein